MWQKINNNINSSNNNNNNDKKSSMLFYSSTASMTVGSQTFNHSREFYFFVYLFFVLAMGCP